MTDKMQYHDLMKQNKWHNNNVFDIDTMGELFFFGFSCIHRGLDITYQRLSRPEKKMVPLYEEK